MGISSSSTRSAAATDLLEKMEVFKRDGFCVFPSFAADKTVASCIAYLSEARRSGSCCVYDLVEKDVDLFLALVANPQILDFCEAIMGPFVQLDGATIVGLRDVGDRRERRVAGWHRDPWAHVPRTTEFERPFAINTLIYLQDLTDDVGPLRVIRGSHREPLTLVHAERRRHHPREEALYPRRGDLVAIHNALVHAGGTPASHVRDRAFVSIFYNLSWLKQTVQLAGRNAADLIRRYRTTNDSRMLRLLGCDPTLLQRNDTGFLEDEEIAWARYLEEDRGETFRP